MLNQYQDIITIDEMCEILVIGRNTAYSLLITNKVHGFKIGKVWKIPKISLEEYILESTRK